MRKSTEAAKKRAAPVRATQKKDKHFWSDIHFSPELLRLMAVVASLMIMLGLLLWGYTWINNPQSLSINQVDIKGELKYIPADELKKQMQPFIQTNLYLLDESGLEQMLEELPWVRSASLRKVWPRRLEVWLEEQVPIAFWGKDRMLNQYGEIFTARLPEKEGIFPLLYSPVDKGREIAERYVYLTQLLNNLSLGIAELTEDEAGVWRIRFREGPEVIIGRKEYEKRLSRFKVGYVQELKERFPQIRRIDLRYTNGFAVEWKQTPVGSS